MMLGKGGVRGIPVLSPIGLSTRISTPINPLNTSKVLITSTIHADVQGGL
jgi:hypothetical protein